MASIRKKRESITDEKIKEILEFYGAPVFKETDIAIIFPTCCHNVNGGSPKLYYYKDTKLFKCYTECHDVFDIFSLIIKREAMAGNIISLGQAIKIMGIDIAQIENEPRESITSLLLQIADQEDMGEAVTLPCLSPSILNNFSTDLNYLVPWIEEGIGLDAIQKYCIRYSKELNAIIIPQFDENHFIVGIRGRFLDPQAPAKYKPILLDGVLLRHSINKTLYGFSHNEDMITETGMCVIFEGEKSVLKMETLFPDKNISVATCGKAISLAHTDLLLSAGVRTVFLAYDTDYTNKEELEQRVAEYTDRAKILSQYFTVFLLIDYEFKLPPKSSPIDGGKDIFNYLIKTRKAI